MDPFRTFAMPKDGSIRHPAARLARGVSFALAFTIALACGSARAQSRAETLFREGREAAEQKNWAAACAKFEESLSYESSVGALVNLGECNEKQGKLVAALGFWRRGLDRMAPEDARRDLATGKIAELEKRAAKIVVMAADDARAFVDGQAAVPGQPWLVDPGTHEIVVIGASGPRKLSVTVREGEVRPVESQPSAEAPSASPPPPPSPSPSPPPSVAEVEVDNPHLVPAVVAFGVGGAGLVVFGVTGALYLGESATVDDECDDRGACSRAGVEAGDRGFTYGVVNAVGLGVAVLGAGVGATLLILGSQESVEVEARARGTSLEVRGSF